MTAMNTIDSIGSVVRSFLAHADRQVVVRGAVGAGSGCSRPALPRPRRRRPRRSGPGPNASRTAHPACQGSSTSSTTRRERPRSIWRPGRSSRGTSRLTLGCCVVMWWWFHRLGERCGERGVVSSIGAEVIDGVDELLQRHLVARPSASRSRVRRLSAEHRRRWSRGRRVDVEVFRSWLSGGRVGGGGRVRREASCGGRGAGRPGG